MLTNNLMKQLGLITLCTTLLLTPVDSVTAAPESGEVTQTLTESVKTGRELESSKNWLNAIEFYEKALKKWPEDKSLKLGLRRTKIHFGIDRRYSDNSFERKLLLKSRQDALDLFDEVLYQIRSYYVEPISSWHFIAHGTESFYLALANKKFQEYHFLNTNAVGVRRMRKILRDQYWNKRVSSRYEALQLITQVCDTAKKEIGLNSAPIIMEYLFGGCNALDNYSNVLTPNRLDDLYGNIEGEFVGLGIEMKAETGKGMHLMNVLPESPAEEGGMKRGDFIVNIDGVNCLNMTTDEAAKLLRGLKGSKVRITLSSKDDGSKKNGVFVRRPVQVKSIPVAEIVDPQHGIGYIKMTGFQATTPGELTRALEKLKRQNMRSLIWDLRGNPGGLLPAATQILDNFIEEGTLVSTRGRNRNDNETFSAHSLGTTRIPLVLLIDGNSASASEIVAGAVRDHKRGTIVGRKSYGKWSVQSILPVKGQTGLRLTTAKFYSPQGFNHSKVGVKPDVLVEQEHLSYYQGRREGSSIDGDKDLKKGIQILKRQLSAR
jgi:carboxyl-terminal processing protease